MRYPPEEAEKVTGVPAEAIRATAREYATERHAAIFYTLGITEHACGVDNIWSLSNLVLMTGHLGYESTGLNALRGQNNVQGLNDSGANPHYLPGYQPVDDPEIRAKFAEALGRRGPGARRLPARPDDERPPRRPREGALPHRREPGADRAERAPRRGGPRQARVPDLAGHLPARHDPQARGRRLPGLVLRGEGRHVHEHRAPHQPRARGGAAAREREGRPRDRHPHGEGARRRLARVPGRGVGLERARRPLAELVRRPLRPARGERDPVAGDRDRRAGHAVPARARAGAPARPRQVLPGRVPAADRGARLRVPARPLDRPHALPLQLGDDDDARVRDHGEAGGAVLRDLRRRRDRARPRARATSRGSSRAAASSRRARRSPTASSPASSGWRSTSPSRR